jgi:peptide/nickel transport system substrate-binding protein
MRWIVDHEDSLLKSDLDALLQTGLTRRQVLKGGAAAGLLLGLGPLAAACGGSNTTTASSASPMAAKRGGEARIGLVGGSAKDLADPHRSLTPTVDSLNWLMFEGLAEFTPDYKVQLLLADEVTPNADASEWTVRVKPDILWHNGKSVTADDVVYSFRRIVDPKNPLDGAQTLIGLKPANITKVDARTVKFRFPDPYVLFGTEGLANDMCHVVPVDFDPKNPVGTGAFKLDSLRPGEQFILSGFKDYHGGAPYLDKLTLIEFGDPSARVNALMSGVIDAMVELPPDQRRVIEASQGMSTLEAKSAGWQCLAMRIDAKPFTDVRVRQAFRLIVDRNQVLQQAFDGVAWIGNDMFSPYDAGYPKDLPQREQDLEQARSLLKQAGYDNDLSLELATSDGVGGGAVQTAQVFAENAKGAGVDVKVRKYDESVIFGDMYGQWPFSSDWWGVRGYLMQAMTSQMPGAPWNTTHWKDDKWLALFREANGTLDETKRNELVGEMNKIDYEDGGFLIYTFKNQLDAYSDKLAGWTKNDVMGVPFGRWRLHDVYLT